MARVKKPDLPPPPPKHPRECKHGCTDCKHYRLDVKAFPCRDCERWNYWEDAHPDKNNVLSLPSTASQPNAPDQVPAPSVEEPKKSGRRIQIVTSQTDTPPAQIEQSPATPKKRGRKSKTDVTTSEKATDDIPVLPSQEKEQLTLF